ncbi:MAG: DUF971 domain-containing protein [Planctomycetota bacterium]|nr:DUF971 domain-containing protein [Planctomycetota bacterium]MEC9008890.1 DUF971 domain-containing protein [Planctomycetota bacterium]MED5401949.1 DUF971 domain-containing protein [Planctomycetota bacterium]MEE3365544.1 DUF971 domain-containing protein [Planctomycetota bacterium]
MSVDVPSRIRFLTEEALLCLDWSDGQSYQIPFRALRQLCPCASCVSETTGQRVLDPDSVPTDIHPTNVSHTGSYALKIIWSDDHDTGLFTWEYLNEIGIAIEQLENDDAD